MGNGKWWHLSASAWGNKYITCIVLMYRHCPFHNSPFLLPIFPIYFITLKWFCTSQTLTYYCLLDWIQMIFYKTRSWWLESICPRRPLLVLFAVSILTNNSREVKRGSGHAAVLFGIEWWHRQVSHLIENWVISNKWNLKKHHWLLKSGN